MARDYFANRYLGFLEMFVREDHSDKLRTATLGYVRSARRLHSDKLRAATLGYVRKKAANG